MKKTSCIVISMLLIVAALAGCSSDKKAETETAAAEEGVYVSINEVKVHTGQAYADVKDALGDEIKPSETIESCDPDSDWVQIMHYYAGTIVSEDKDGNIMSIEVTDREQASDAAFLCAPDPVRLGDKFEDVKTIIGEPDQEDEYSLFYTSGDPMIYIYLDENAGTVTGIMLMGATQ